MKYEFDLGQEVYCFNLGIPEEEVMKGYISAIGISLEGKTQYTISSGERKILSLAKFLSLSQEKAQEKLDEYRDFVKQQREASDKYFGEPDFNIEKLKGN